MGCARRAKFRGDMKFVAFDPEIAGGRSQEDDSDRKLRWSDTGNCEELLKNCEDGVAESSVSPQKSFSLATAAPANGYDEGLKEEPLQELWKKILRSLDGHEVRGMQS